MLLMCPSLPNLPVPPPLTLSHTHTHTTLAFPHVHSHDVITDWRHWTPSLQKTLSTDHGFTSADKFPDKTVHVRGCRSQLCRRLTSRGFSESLSVPRKNSHLPFRHALVPVFVWCLRCNPCGRLNTADTCEHQSACKRVKQQ